MTGLRLPKLPDRTPVKIAVTLTPDVKEALDLYGDLYARTYGRTENVADLAAAIIEQYLLADREFAKELRASQSRP
jgi:hypothetical protein